MVLRQSQNIQMSTPQTVGIQQSQMGAASLQKIAGKYQTVLPERRGAANLGVLSGLVDVLAGSAQKIASRAMEVSQEEAYIAGAAHAETRQSEATLEGNLLTKDWATAGWRDTMGKLALADSDSQSAVDMYALRLNEQPPEKFEEYLTATRNKLQPQLEGMSLAARKSMMGQQIMQDRALIKQHGLAYNKHIVDTRGRALKANVSTKIDQLEASKKRFGVGDDDAESYTAHTANVYSAMKDIWADEVLPLTAKQKFTNEIMEYALGQDHQLLYSVFTESKDLTGADGRPTSMRNMLETDDQTKLNANQRSSLDRTATVRYAAWSEKKGLLEGNFSDDTKEMPTYKSYLGFLNEGMQIGAIKTPAAFESAIESYTKAAAKRGKESGMGVAVANGNIAAILAQGTVGEAVGAYATQLLKSNNTLAQTSSKLLDAGLAHGYVEALQWVGKANAAGFRQMFANPTMNQETMQSTQSLLTRISKAEDAGQPGLLASLLSTVDPETQGLLSTMSAELRKGTDPVSAITKAASRALETAKLTPNQKAVAAGDMETEIQAELATFGPMSVPGMLANKAKQIASGLTGGWAFKTAGALGEVSTTGGFGNADAIAADGMRHSKVHYATLLRQVAAEEPWGGMPEIRHIALGRLLASTIPVQSGVLTIDPGIKSIPEYFGAKAQGSVDTGMLGKALDSLHTIPNSVTSYQYTSRGIQYTTRSDKDGKQLATGIHDPKLVGAKAEEMGRAAAKRWDTESGRGVSAQVRGAVRPGAAQAIHYNGENTALLADATMLTLRNTLVKFEGVRNTSYTLKGESSPTNGVGFHGDYYVKPDASGTITPAQIQTQFIRASNDAADSGVKAAKLYAVPKESGILLMSELAYHAGTSFYQKDYFKPFLATLQTKDTNAAVTEFKRTPAWTRLPANSPRREHYLALIKDITGG